MASLASEIERREFAESLADPLGVMSREGENRSISSLITAVVESVRNVSKYTTSFTLDLTMRLMNLGSKIFRAVWSPFYSAAQWLKKSAGSAVNWAVNTAVNSAVGALPDWAGDAVYCGALIMLIGICNAADLGYTVPFFLNAVLNFMFGGGSKIRNVVSSIYSSYNIYCSGFSMGSKLKSTNVTVINQHQTRQPHFEADDGSWSPVEFVFSSTAKLTACLLSLVLVCTLPSTQNFDGLLRRFDLVPKAIKGITSMTEAVESGMKYAFGEHYKDVFGETTIPATDIPDVIRQHCERCLQLCQSDTYTRIAGDPALCQEISDLYNKYQRFRVENARNRLIQSYLDKYGGAVVSLFQKASSHAPKSNENRPKPTLLALRGGTGVGKSQLLYFICASILARDGRIPRNATPEEINDLCASCMYARNPDQEFWDAYMAQYITLWDDFGQIVDSATKPDPSWQELIHAVNTFPYPLHMADISQKANTYFKSEYVVLTTNLKNMRPASVVDVDAVLSRLHFKYEVRVRPEYRMDPSAPETDEMGCRLNPEYTMQKHQGQMSLEPYEFYEYDFIGGQASGTPISFTDLVQRLVDHHAHQKRTFEASRVALAQHVQAELQGDDWAITRALKTVGRGIARIPGLAPESESGLCAVFRRRAVDQIRMDLFYLDSSIRQSQRDLERYYFWYGLIGVVTLVIGMVYALYCFVKQDEKVSEPETESGMTKTTVLPKILVESGRDKDSTVPRVKVESGRAKETRVRPVKIEGVCFESGRGKEPIQRLVRVEASGDIQKTLKDITVADTKEAQELAAELKQAFYDPVLREQYYDTETCIMGFLLPGDIVLMISDVTYPSLEGYASTQSQEVVQKVAAKSFFVLRHPTTSGYLCPVVCFGGRIYGVNKHYWDKVASNISAIKLTTPWSVNGTVVTISRIEVTQFARVEGEVTDLVLLKMPLCVPLGFSLWKHFHSLKDFDAVKGMRVTLVGWQNTDPPTLSNKTGKIDHVWTEPITLPSVRLVSRFYHCDVSSHKGDCGGLYIADSHVIKNRVLGFHFAGTQPGGLMQPLYYEDFEKIMENEVQMLEIPGVEIVQEGPPLEGIILHGRVAPELKCHSNVNTQFVKTPLYNVVAKSEVKPAQLGPILQPGGVGLKALSKVTGDVPAICQRTLARAKASFQQKVLVGDFNPNERRVLTFEEAVAGIPGEQFIAGINRSRSAGWPWCLQTRQPGKTKWFGSHDWVLNSTEALEVKERVEEIQRQLGAGEWQPAVFVDTEKDETRPVEKVDQGKTRAFAAAPMDFVIVFRMYFLGFLSYVMRKRIYNELTVGICAQSMDWDRLGRHLRQKGDNIIAGDFSNYDGTLHPDILYACLDIINEFYQDEFAEHRRILFENVCHSYHIADEFVYGWTHSQPSGNPGTAVLNSMYNSIVCRMVYYILEAEQGDSNAIHDTFNEHIAMASYGDDNLLSVSSEVKSWFTMEAMCEKMSLMGMTYTSEQKDGKTYLHKPLTQCTFLQRGFRQEPKYNYWLGPLNARSINERLNWAQKSRNPEEALRQNIDGAIAEWALHPKDDFERWSRKIANASLNICNYAPQVLPHYMYIERVLFGDYIKSFPGLQFT